MSPPWANRPEDSDVEAWHDPRGRLTDDDLSHVKDNLEAWVRKARRELDNLVIVEALREGGVSEETIAEVLET